MFLIHVNSDSDLGVHPVLASTSTSFLSSQFSIPIQPLLHPYPANFDDIMIPYCPGLTRTATANIAIFYVLEYEYAVLTCTFPHGWCSALSAHAQPAALGSPQVPQGGLYPVHGRLLNPDYASKC